MQFLPHLEDHFFHHSISVGFLPLPPSHLWLLNSLGYLQTPKGLRALLEGLKRWGRYISLQIEHRPDLSC